jgi:hypothetical protein
MVGISISSFQQETDDGAEPLMIRDRSAETVIEGVFRANAPALIHV